MKLIKSIVSPVVRDYWIGRTFTHRLVQSTFKRPGEINLSSDIELRALCSSDDGSIANQCDPELAKHYYPAKPGVRCFGAWIGGKLTALCTFTFGEEYVQSGGFYDLGADQAELADIFTTSQGRGKGVATALIKYSTAAMEELGYRTLFAKVWHSNTSSTRTFKKAGWTQKCFFIRLYPQKLTSYLHFEWRLH
jgi:GNAT superfamily N-acetyltransferase